MGVRQRHRKTLMLTVSAMLCALGVVLLGIGSMLESIDLTAASLASILCVYAVIELGGAYPWMIWAVTALLGFLLLPQKSPAVFYLFIGFYPILKEKAEKLPRTLSMVVKLVIITVMIALLYLVIHIFLPQETEPGFRWIFLMSYLPFVLVFLLFDYALSKLITFYLIRLRPRFGLKLKK